MQGLSQSAVGKMAGMSPSQVGKSLRAERILDIEQIARICAGLGLDMVQAITDADTARRQI
jgi:transcriptional regulator with XRE-family HTH domain